MATHPRHAVNGNGNGDGGHGGLTLKKIEKLYALHDGIATALRTTLQLLRGEAVDRKVETGPDVLTAAVRLDAQRRAPRAPAGTHTAMVNERRQKTAALLATMDLHKPTNPGGRSLGVLIQHGFIKRKGDGYIRTAKDFEP
jgi:hypothetical protein